MGYRCDKESLYEGNLSVDDSDSMILIRDVLEQNVNVQRLPSETLVEWSEDVGNSKCKLRKDSAVNVYNKSIGENEIYSGEEFNAYMIAKYGQDYVKYSHREPDFEPFEQEIRALDFNVFLQEKYGQAEHPHVTEDYPGHLELEHMDTERSNGTYKQALQRVAESLGVSKQDIANYMKSRNLTWHECGDGKTMRIVPSEINQVFKHTGGIGIQKDKEALAEATIRAIGRSKYVLDSQSGKIVDKQELMEAIENKRIQIKKIKRELFS